MDSDSELLEISRNTIEVMGRWIDGNGSNSFFPAAVRVGYDPKVIWTQLTRYVTTCTQPNGFTARNPHGVENCSIVPNTINMMLCSGHQGVLRVFGVWPKDRDARFGRLRAYGAFLVSSELKGGKVRYVNILSEKGRPCTLQNPWPGKKATLTRNGSAGPELLEGKRFTFKTAPDQRIEIKPAN